MWKTASLVCSNIHCNTHHTMRWKTRNKWTSNPWESMATKHSNTLHLKTFSGTENVFRRWSPAHAQTKRLTMDFGFCDGDTLIMVIDGDERECSVYVNQINDRYLIRNQLKSKQYTFKNIPQQFILVYGAHAVDMDDIDTAHASHVEVEVRLLQLIPKKQMDKGNAEEAVEDEEDVDEYEHEY
eukprot:483591_1